MRKTSLVPALLLASLCAVAPSVASAFDAPPAFAGRPMFERYQPNAALPASAQARSSRVWDRAPRVSVVAYNKFLADMAARGGHSFRASFDERSGVPSRIYGAGIEAPGAVADGALAEAFAYDLLSDHVRLFAPGSKTSDFVLVANDLDRGMRTVAYAQLKDGERVRGGQVNFRFKNDMLQMIGSEALPWVPSFTSTQEVSEADAEKAALGWVSSDFGRAATRSIGNALLVPFATAGGRIAYARALPVVVDTLDTAGRFEVFVDLESGRPVARQQLLHFASSSVLLNVPTRAPAYGPRIDAPAVLATLNIEGAAASTSPFGAVSWAGTSPTPIEVFLTGSRVRVLNDAGLEASLNVSIADSTPLVWNASDDESVDAQLTAFVHGETVREFARTFAPQQSFLNQQVQATVNIADVCNAYSDGTTINFYASGQGCENTGRIADVIYHEYGHSLHAHAIIEGVGEFDGALSEGASDYLAATITGDPATARGFFMNANPLRDIDPLSSENRWPEDLVGEVHEDGKIIGQALWDMRKELVLSLGEAEGVLLANELYYQGLRRAVDIPTMYIEILAADDDDGDLTNGTPNVCEINRAFDLHGLRSSGTVSSSLGVTPVSQDGYHVEAEITGLYPQCPGDALVGGTLRWRDRSDPGLIGEIPLELDGNKLSATIPEQTAGTVVRYQLDVDLDSGSMVLPDNAADDEYEFFIGDVTPLYCTDFESDPLDEGWQHGLEEGEETEGADDWAWGEANGSPKNGDPSTAFSGDNVFGNDISLEDNFNGLYQPDKINYAQSPIVDTAGHTNVRLQYRRWLNVEDAHFDRASIMVDNELLWQNLDSDSGDTSKTHHQDREWRFQDVDLSNNIDADGKVRVTFKLASDGGLELGGWTIDDFCIVAFDAPIEPPCEGVGCENEGGGNAGGEGAGGGENINPMDDPDDGCGCDVPAAPARSSWLALGFLGGLAMLARRRLSRLL